MRCASSERGQLLRHARDADVPGDVALALRGADAEVAYAAWNELAGMVAGEEERRAAVVVSLPHRGGFVGREQREGS